MALRVVGPADGEAVPLGGEGDGDGDARSATVGGEDGPGALAAPPPPGWPEPLHRDALAGFAGEVVGGLLPHTEADEAGLLLTLLAAVGNVVGLRAWWEVSGQRHGFRVWPVLVGATARGRKGTTWGTLAPVLAVTAPDWFRTCVATGLSSGEGLIAALKDPDPEPQPAPDRLGRLPLPVRPPGGADPDKRLFLIEEEFGGTLAVANREGNSLSAVVRKAFDGGPLATLTRTAPLRASGGHVSVLGHTSKEELRQNLRSTEIANGFANRFLFACVRRSKLLPDGGALPAGLIAGLADGLRRRLFMLPPEGKAFARSPAAARLWRVVYPALSAERPGLTGAVAARAEVQVMRLACVYAVLDGRRLVEPADLAAALAVWDYSLASLRWIFGWQTGDEVADALLNALSRGPMTNEEVISLFGRRVPAARIERAIRPLIAERIVVVEKGVPGPRGGRPPMRWRLAAEAVA